MLILSYPVLVTVKIQKISCMSQNKKKNIYITIILHISVVACYHPNVGIFWGAWHVQQKKSSKKDPTPVKPLFENTMRNPFFYFFNY